MNEVRNPGTEASIGGELLRRRIHIELKLRFPSLIVRQPRSVRRFIGTVLQVNALQVHLDATDVGFSPRISNLVHQQSPELIDPVRPCDRVRKDRRSRRRVCRR